MNKEFSAIDKTKNSIIDSSLVVGTILGFIAYFLSLSRWPEYGFEWSYVTDLAALMIATSVAYFRRKLNIRLKSIVVIIAIMAVVVVDMFELGILGANKVLLIVVPFFAYIAFNFRQTMYIILTTIIMVIVSK